jgi:hypothetical protein
MRITAPLLLISLTLPAAAPALPAGKISGAIRKPCVAAASVARAKRGVKSGPQRLGDLPDAAEIKTVYREVDGCPRPVVQRGRIGSNPTAPRPRLDAPPRIVAAR